MNMLAFQIIASVLLSLGFSFAVDIPVINIWPLFNPSSKANEVIDVADEIIEAFSKYGLFYATGHKLSKYNQIDAFESARNYFSLAKEKKENCAFGRNRGYIGIGAESGSDVLEYKEAFEFGYSFDEGFLPKHAMHRLNCWPLELDVGHEFKPRMEHLFDASISILEKIARAVSASLNWPEDVISTICSESDVISFLRIFHYLPVESDSVVDLNTKSGSSPHTDWGMLTLLMQDETGGLQFWDNSKKSCKSDLSTEKADFWIDVSPRSDDSVIILAGDFLRLMSGGVVYSPIHRVISKPVDRFSFVLFYYPSFDTRLDVMDTAIENNGLREETDFLKFNTLLDSITLEELKQVPFGEYLGSKWKNTVRA